MPTGLFSETGVHSNTCAVVIFSVTAPTQGSFSDEVEATIAKLARLLKEIRDYLTLASIFQATFWYVGDPKGEATIKQLCGKVFKKPVGAIVRVEGLSKGARFMITGETR